jgi:hypothetical protein
VDVPRWGRDVSGTASRRSAGPADDVRGVTAAFFTPSSCDDVQPRHNPCALGACGGLAAQHVGNAPVAARRGSNYALLAAPKPVQPSAGS